MKETRNKTITVAIRDGKKREISNRTGWGWLLPPEEDGLTGEGYIGGAYAYKECIKRWKEKGWTVQREPNPLYREPDPLRGIFKF
jgi:hypothetical protein|tara:strand:+ start:245 stop:499 length:255 start_codon:yes stop_codon:yes gene_type:complete